MDEESDYDPQRKVRMPEDEWGPFLAAAKTMHPDGRSPRGKVLREFVRWYLSRPGADLPERPPAGAWSAPPADE